MRKSICILGSTGSIGTSTLKLIAEYKNKYQIETLTANVNIEKLAKQAIEFKAKNVVVADQNRYIELKQLLSGYDIKIYAGNQGLLDLSSFKYDVCIVGIVGMIAIKPIMNAISNSKVVAIANKESIVCAGKFIIREAKKHNTNIIPLDSEHNAIFQVLEEENRDNIKKIVLTASGGPFLYTNAIDLLNVTPKRALEHPNWQMGDKISVDSATMVNKGLEVIEACKIFNLNIDQVDAIVHPQSIIHGMIHYRDGSVLSQMAHHDMRTPISFCLEYPKRTKFNCKILDLTKIRELSFFPIDKRQFPLFFLAKEAYSEGEYSTVAFNLANEIAVKNFLRGKIKFLDINTFIQKVLVSCPRSDLDSIDQILEYSSELMNIYDAI